MTGLAQRISKYPEFVEHENDELVYTNSSYSVFRNTRLRLYFLVRNGRRVADKQMSARDILPFDNEGVVSWIAKWEKNARNQIERLRQRIEDLEAEAREIEQTLGD